MLKKSALNRYSLLDTVRGVLVAGMIIYHTAFDAVAFFGNVNDSALLDALTAVRDLGAFLFIFLSGVCFHFGKKRLKRFLLLFISGLIVSLVTYVVMPECTVIFGILTFMSVSELILLALKKPMSKLSPVLGLTVSLLLFLVLFRVNYAYIGTYHRVFAVLPHALYKNYITAFFGFPFLGFSSGDYYPVLPWCFASMAGFFCWRLIEPKKEKLIRILRFNIKPFSFLGRYSLYIYLAHQPVVYGVMFVVSKIVAR